MSLHEQSCFQNPWLGVWLFLTYVCYMNSANASPTTSSLEQSPEFCEHWKTYKDPQTGKCLPCSPCPEDYITVVKCEFDRDTLCRPGTDLAKHIESVVKSSSSVLVSEKNTTAVVIVEEETVFEQLLGGMEYSPVLVIILSIAVIGCVLFIVIHTLRKQKNRPIPRGQLRDPLQESLLAEAEEHEEETEKPAPNMDELLAQRYGRSLVKNVYVP